MNRNYYVDPKILRATAGKCYGSGRVRYELGGKLYTSDGYEVPRSVFADDERRLAEGLDQLPDREVLPAFTVAPPVEMMLEDPADEVLPGETGEVLSIEEAPTKPVESDDLKLPEANVDESRKQAELLAMDAKTLRLVLAGMNEERAKKGQLLVAFPIGSTKAEMVAILVKANAETQ